ncbi:MAG TPA: hypothetical protein VKA15_23775 [Isosphaeraceae bacterium]|nr:hypothetical protein [Isosphaeraceae bacterium]
MPPFTRRSFALSLLIAPIACLGCGGDDVSVNTKAGEKRRQMIEDLQKRADLKRKSGEKKAPSR